jgi:hypothetical protein
LIERLALQADEHWLDLDGGTRWFGAPTVDHFESWTAVRAERSTGGRPDSLFNATTHHEARRPD